SSEERSTTSTTSPLSSGNNGHRSKADPVGGYKDIVHPAAPALEELLPPLVMNVAVDAVADAVALQQLGKAAGAGLAIEWRVMECGNDPLMARPPRALQGELQAHQFAPVDLLIVLAVKALFAGADPSPAAADGPALVDVVIVLQGGHARRQRRAHL